MTERSASPVPPGLAAKGKRLWTDITERYELRSDELRILEDACREADLIDRIERELKKRSAKLVVNGSMGQPVANPLMQEVRQHRNVLAGLLGKLKLTDDGSHREQERPRSSSAREAALARWGKASA